MEKCTFWRWLNEQNMLPQQLAKFINFSRSSKQPDKSEMYSQASGRRQTRHLSFSHQLRKSRLHLNIGNKPIYDGQEVDWTWLTVGGCKPKTTSKLAGSASMEWAFSYLDTKLFLHLMAAGYPILLYTQSSNWINGSLAQLEENGR